MAEGRKAKEIMRKTLLFIKSMLIAIVATASNDPESYCEGEKDAK